MQEILTYKYWGNTLLNYLTAAGILVSGIVFIIILKRIILIRLKRWADTSSNKIDDFIVVGIERSLIPMLYIGVFCIAINTFTLPPQMR
jgi:hypothetical protein